MRHRTLRFHPHGTRPGRTFLLAVPLCLCCALAPGLLTAGVARAQDKSDEETLKEQRAKGPANWKKGMQKENPPHLETEHFLIFGEAPDKQLKDVGAALEQQFAAASKVLELTKDDHWKGKLAVYLVPDRKDFSAFTRRVEGRRVDADERGSVSIDNDFPHVIAGPPHILAELSVEEQAGAQLGIALLKKKFGKFVPAWMEEGFGRATALKTASEARRALERKLVQGLINKGRKAKDAWDGELEEAEAGPLRGSVIEYLAYSGRTTKFLQIVNGFRPDENNTKPTVEGAFRAAGVSNLEYLNKVWRAWAPRAP